MELEAIENAEGEDGGWVGLDGHVEEDTIGVEVMFEV